MDIFVRNIADEASKKSLNDFFREKLRQINVHEFSFERLRSRGCGLLTLLTPEKGQKFLDNYSDPRRPLRHHSRIMYCKKSQDEPDALKIRAIAKEAKDKAKSGGVLSNGITLKEKQPYPDTLAKFDCRILSCGTWDYLEGELTHVSHVRYLCFGTLHFGKTTLALVLKGNPNSKESSVRLDFSYATCIESITTGSFQNPTLTLTLRAAPRMFEVPEISEDVHLALGMMSLLQRRPPRKPKRIRMASLEPGHAALVGNCFTYQVTLCAGDQLHLVKAKLDSHPGMPRSIYWPCQTVRRSSNAFVSQVASLNTFMAGVYSHFDFALKFQIQRLALNGYLPPATIVNLLPIISEIVKRSDMELGIRSVRKLFKQIPYAGPEADSTCFSTQHLINLLYENEDACKQEESLMFSILKKHPHMVMVHRVVVTPTGIYLEGPNAEVKNRVLRKFSDKVKDSFLRVSFVDEDYEGLFYSPFIDLQRIYQTRFKMVLGSPIVLAGKSFEYLGFSHSSLREQVCWFMCPIEHEGVRLTARDVVAGLGDFTEFRSPAKCGARIGQAFSETPVSVTIPSEVIREIPDVERPNGRAKGMLSLDTTLEGDVVCIRPSMTKFPAPHTDLEICRGAFRPLPLYLNRSLIKVLEDLGVRGRAFMDLQQDMVDKLRSTTKSPVNAANFLERNDLGKVAHLPWLVKNLYYMNVSFLEDRFLRSTIELAILTQLRELKHRSRIEVPDGVTLFGVMDETNTLKEGQIYCRTDTAVVEGRVAITRSPAMHPGDVQVVDAVDVPDECSLNALHNCVVFSSQGERDLPSQLSGGDLDGDLYNVIFDDRLIPKKTVQAADYPRLAPVDIGRTVKASDMADFFLDFMQNDQLGRLSKLHMQLADLYEEGSLHPDCITLAQMCSTAVDFSKTGIPVDVSQCPRYKMYRPDFMAGSPHIKIEGKLPDIVDDAPAVDDDTEDAVTAMDPDSKGYRFYESDKSLGHLYRAIDEKAFLKELKEQAADLKPSDTKVVKQIWDFVKARTRLVIWDHHVKWAKELRAGYEESLTNMLYDHSTHPTNPLSELEVFTGTILGKNGGLPSRRVRETSATMKQEFEDHCAHYVACIAHSADDAGGRGGEALERSIACLSEALKEGEALPRIGRLVSWRYVCAAVCLREVEKFVHGFGTGERVANGV